MWLFITIQERKFYRKKCCIFLQVFTIIFAEFRKKVLVSITCRSYSYTDADLKLFLYIPVHIKIMTGKFRFLKPINLPVKFVKCLFANILKQQNKLKSSLLFKEKADFPRELLELRKRNFQGISFT